jgi:RHS repeat-associated protein
MRGWSTTGSRTRLLWCALLSGTLAGSLLVVPPAEAKPPTPERLKAQVEQLDRDGGEVHGRAWTQQGQPKVATPAPVWPRAGAAQAVLPASGDRRSSVASGMRVGALPVWVDRAAGAAGQRLSEVTVEVLDRAQAPVAWRDGLLLRVAGSRGTPGVGAARLTVDYSGFRYAFGADWASRLRLWQLPPCAISTPNKPECGATPLPSTNKTASGVVSAEVPVTAAGGASTLVAVAAAASGPAGDFTATSLSPSSTWTSGGSSGAFSWSYPLRVPPAMGGPTPNISFAYSSSSVDGRSAATNNQPSWLGEGFEYSPGFIERRYVPCSEDMAGSANNNTKTGDQCWRSDNATMSLNGGGDELVFENGKGWHARSEDGSKVEKLTGASNGDNDGEYWKVTTSDGVQYFFGLNKLAGQSVDTDSAWTVPVYGNHSGEPCHAGAFADSDCAQAWRWNLDYVVDPRGNTMSFWYDKELNQYAANLTDSDNVQYVRGGYLKRIDYGTWDRGSADRSVTPIAQVSFDTADRCLSGCGTHDASHWPDLPWDQECKTDATECPGLYSPTFWSTKRLSRVTARVWDTTKATPAWQDVDSWTLTHSFPSPGDGTDAGLWLASISHAGLVGSAVTVPPVTFEPTSLPNRVLTPTNTTNNWQRIANIVTETGAKIQVTYSLPECTSTNLPAAAETNTKRCYPVIGPDPYDQDGKLITEWWHKYVVQQVSETDLQLVDGHQTPTKNTYYNYVDSPAWHYADDDGLTKPNRKTWSQFRGYATVKVRVGDAAGTQTLTETHYLRGMHGDRSSPSGGSRSVPVPASVGSETVYDEDAFAGMVREQIVDNGDENKPVTKTVNVPWQSTPATASRTINGDTVTARFTNTQTTYQSTALGVNGERGWRTSRATSTFDSTYGTVISTQDDGDIAVPGDERCVSYVYNRNVDKNLILLVKQTTTTVLACGVAPSTEDDVVADVRNTYDGAISADTTPVYGGVTKAEALKGWSAATGTDFQTVSQATFDVFGRVLTNTDIKANVTTTAYTPASGGPVTKVTTTSPLGWVSTTDVAPYWGATTKTTDPNGRIAEGEYDALGRTSKVWSVGWPKADHPDRPSTEYTYTYSAGRSDYPYTTSKTVRAGGGVLTTYQIFDAFLRPRQTQTAGVGGGRVVTDSLNDAWGRVAVSYGAHAEPGDPSGALWWEPEWSVPAVTKTVYDNANRPTASIFLAGDGVTNLVEKWRTTTTYAGDQTAVTPPSGATPTTTVSDIRGRTVELRQHITTAGVTGAYDTTRYTYNRKDQLAKVTDPAGNEWAYTLDIKGRQIEARDPDKGTTRSDYNDYNELVKTTDARGEVLAYEYDQIGRKIALYDDTVSAATKRAEWKYDKLYTGVTVRGQLTQTIRYDPVGSTTAYKWQVVNFNTRYQAVGVYYVIPATETGLGGSYGYSRGYSEADGSPTYVGFPSGGGLTGETVTMAYDSTYGLPVTLQTSLINISSYVIGQQYTSYGEPTLTTRKIAGGVYAEDATYYDTATRRVSRTTVKPETATGTVSDRAYTYDPAGNITSIADTPQVGTADTQCLRYDALRRLSAGWTPKTGVTCPTDPTVANLGGAAPYWLDWTFDKIGNRLSETSHATAGNTTRTYTVPTSGPDATRPHSVTAATTQAPGQAAVNTTYGYDAAGNTTTRPSPTNTGQTLTWDAEDHLATVTDGTATTTNLYDPDGARLIRRDTTGTTLYLPDMEIRRDAATGATTGTRYYTFAGRTVASRTPAGLTWLYTDHQNTQQIAVDALTQQVTVRRQTPYGGPRGTQPTWPNTRGFVGGDTDPTGLTHLGAREYDPGIGRFISVDPIQDLTDPQQWNAYTYTANNPITASDPTGLKAACGPEFDIPCGSYDNHPTNPSHSNGGGGGGGGGGHTCKQQKGCGGATRQTGGTSATKTICGRSGCYQAVDRPAATSPGCLRYTCTPVCFDGSSWDCEISGAWYGLISVTTALSVSLDLMLWADGVPGDEEAAAGVEAAVIRAEARQAEAAEASTISIRSGTGNVISGSAAGERLAQKLRAESAQSVFDANNEITQEALGESRLIMRAIDLKNKAARAHLTADGSNLEDWGKYTTRTHQSTYGDYQVHFYYNPATARIAYGYDYKVVMNAR